jgi:serine/threonine protein kinase
VELLAGRYQMERELGRGAASATHLAHDTQTGAAVIAKLLSLALVTDWKSLELFEREAEVLKGLHHERIPAYVDSFRADLGGEPRFVLIRQYVSGSDLQEKVAGGWRGTEEQIRGIGRQLVGIVGYIHSLRPPVIHRDINPRNIVMREDGAIFLVDFGGVQDAIRLSAPAASTMIGTPGYAPMEQFVGHATVRSDLYGLAATLVFLLTRRSPADLPTRNLKVDLGPLIDLASPGLRRVLSAWLEPDETARTLTLEQADALLAGEGVPAAVTAAEPPARPPSGSRIVHTADGLVHVWVLPLGSRIRRMGTFGIAWLGFVGFWTYSAFRMKAPIGFLFFAVPFLGVGLGIVRQALAAVFGKLALEIGPHGAAYSRRFVFPSKRREVPLSDAGDCRLQEALYLDLGARTLRFGEGLSTREKEWLRDSINGALLRARQA